MSNFFPQVLLPPLPNRRKYFENLSAFDAQSSYDGRTYAVIASKDELPEFNSLENAESKDLLSESFVNYVTRIQRSQIESFFEQRNTLSTYLRVWMLHYTVENGKDTINGPWSSDRLCFDGLECQNPSLPVYDPQDVKMQHTKNALLFGELGGEKIRCIVPPLFSLTLTSFHDQIRGFFKEREDKDCCMPKLKGFIGYQKEDSVCYVVGLAIEVVTGIPLSFLSVPDSLRQELRARVQKGHGSLRRCRREFFDGKGPEDVIVTEAGQLYFCSTAAVPARPFGSWAESGNDGLQKVMSFLKQRQEKRPRRSKRVQERSWTLNPVIPDRGGLTLTDLPTELRLVIYEYVLVFPGRIFWAFDRFLSAKIKYDGSGVVLHTWGDGSLAKILREARSFFYEKNDFLVEVNWLYRFLSESNFVSELERITIQVDAGQPDGSSKPWAEGIRELSRKCPRLKRICVSIYGDYTRRFLQIEYKNHRVLRELQRVFWERIAEVELRNPSVLVWTEDEGADVEDFSYKFWEDKILHWLKSQS